MNCSYRNPSTSKQQQQLENSQFCYQDIVSIITKYFVLEIPIIFMWANTLVFAYKIILEYCFLSHVLWKDSIFQAILQADAGCSCAAPASRPASFPLTILTQILMKYAILWNFIYPI